MTHNHPRRRAHNIGVSLGAMTVALLTAGAAMARTSRRPPKSKKS